MKELVILQEGLESTYEIENLYEVFVIRSKIHFAENEADFNQKLSECDYGLIVQFMSHEIKIILMENLRTMRPQLLAETVSSINNGKVLDSRTLFVRDDNQKKVKNQLKRAVYKILEPYFTPMSKWGILVGIRPVKIVHELLDEGETLDQVRETLKELYLIQADKVELLIEIALRERPHLVPNNPNAISLYMCIPFCPTRCVYCSFPSNDLKQKGKLLPEYMDKLEREVVYAINHIHSVGKYIDCIYIGGGTPTSIDEIQLNSLLETIGNHLDLKIVKEYTVEAGRPDTINLEKLEIMKRHGVNRICINPQTLNAETLISIGRAHTSEEIVSTMALAKSIGFETINMDLIMGLPGETPEDAIRTVNKVMALDPENITIHTLSVKRASRLHEEADHYELAHDKEVSKMLDLSDQVIRKGNLTPYYMYRQKKMIGHLENVGYAKPGHESLYNMRIMEEKHTIVACGAGAVSKICTPEENRFERVANIKGLEAYLDRFDEILLKKTLLK